MSFNLRVHHFEKRGGNTVLTRVTPYIRLSRQGDGVVFLQRGKVYSEGGPRINPVPAWVWEDVKKLKESYRAQYGFSDADIARMTAPDAPPEPEEPELLPVRNEEEPPPVPNRSLTSEEAASMTFAQLKAYAAQYNLTSNGKESLISKLTEEGYIH